MAGQVKAHYDIIINGGGIVGFALLNLLTKSPYLNRCKILLIEQAKKPAHFTQYPRENQDGTRTFSNRVSSLSYASKTAFKRLGVWDNVKAFAKDIRKIKVWNYDYNHKIVFNQDLSSCESDNQEKDVVFSIIENNRLASSLLENIYTSSMTSEPITWSSKLMSIEESLDAGKLDVLVQKESGEDTRITGSLILGCDGYNSKVREIACLKYTECDLKKFAVVGTVKMSTQPMNSENVIAYQKFSAEKDSVAALLPLDSEFSSFVISAPQNYAKHLIDCQDDDFVQEFNQLMTSSETASNPILRSAHEITNATCDNLKSLLQIAGPRLGISSRLFEEDFEFDEPPRLDYVVPKSRASFPLVFGTTSPHMIASLPGLDRPQIALLGDASHRVHPLAGQGLNMGVQDAVELVNQLEKISRAGNRIFNEPVLLKKALQRFEFKRQAYVIPMSATILALQDIFKLVPSRVISKFNRCQPMKTASVRVANGA